jgi:hypothetical protein
MRKDQQLCFLQPALLLFLFAFSAALRTLRFSLFEAITLMTDGGYPSTSGGIFALQSAVMVLQARLCLRIAA